MLPFISEDIRDNILDEALQDVNTWRKSMIHTVKEMNPEVNAAIIEAANKTSLDPKAIALGAYLVYKMFEASMGEEDHNIEDILCP